MSAFNNFNNRLKISGIFPVAFQKILVKSTVCEPMENNN